MPQSAEIKDLATALTKAQSVINAAKKDANNPFFNSSYATLQSVWDAARQVLAPNGLAVVQTFEPTDGKTLNLTTTLVHTSGQWIAGTISVTPTKADPQGAGSAATYARRYSLAAIVGIVADEDDDGNAASAPKQAKKPEAYKPTGPMITPDTNKALSALCSDGNMATKLTAALEKKGLLSFVELSETDALALLKWATKTK